MESSDCFSQVEKKGKEEWKGTLCSYIGYQLKFIVSFFISLTLIGHKFNQTNVIMVLKEVNAITRLSKALKFSEELHVDALNCDEEEALGTLSAFCVKSGKTWKGLKMILNEFKETRAVEIISLMEQYVCEGSLLLRSVTHHSLITPLLPQMLHSPLNTCMKW